MKDYLDDLNWPHLRRRTRFEHQQGAVAWFLIKLEYNRNPRVMENDDWCGIARFDHNPNALNGHDIRTEGLHLDILDEHGNKVDVKRGFDSYSPNKAVGFCERYFRRHGATLAEDFERRAGINGVYTP